jgi:hypothetical protein
MCCAPDDPDRSPARTRAAYYPLTSRFGNARELIYLRASLGVCAMSETAVKVEVIAAGFLAGIGR